MQCDHAQEFISEYVTGEMDRALVVTLENHLKACPPCSDTVEGLRRLWTTLEQVPLVEPPASFHATVMERIAAEDGKKQGIAGSPVPVPAWRGLLQPHVFAYAAVALVLLLGAELVQVQRAALGPLGLILNVAHPAPILTMRRVDWIPGAEGGGTLSIRLQARPRINGAVGRFHYHVQIDARDPSIAPGVRHASRDGELTSQQMTVVSIPLGFTPDAADVANVTLTPIDGASDSDTVAIPVGPIR